MSETHNSHIWENVEYSIPRRSSNKKQDWEKLQQNLRTMFYET